MNDLLDRGHRVIVFTQYLDTLDFIRDQLIARYGIPHRLLLGPRRRGVGRRRERLAVVDKSEVKARCKRSQPRSIDILLGTDAASEGLNLQEFSALVNYDLPWNPMRVEQRIGRIDRIGQERQGGVVSNLYMTGTIEEDTYWTLKDRIGVFENVVGPLQPILAEMPRIFRKLAQGEIELNEARSLLDQAAGDPSPMLPSPPSKTAPEKMGDADVEAEERGPGQSVDPEQLAAWCLLHLAPGMRGQ